ncbi:MAG: thioesterase family protein [Desulfatitalea sp.]|nr:thioesterase family protein [Desulfatitalea sp.]
MGQVSLAQIARLPLYHRQTIPTEYIDAMGHMNVRWYMALFDNATWRFFDAMGLDDAYFERTHAGGFALKHFVTYWAEVQAGQTVAVHTRILGRSDKRFHFMHFMVNESAGVTAAALESLGTHVDLRQRKSSPLPARIAKRFDTQLVEDRQLPWPAPICGAIDV